MALFVPLEFTGPSTFEAGVLMLRTSGGRTSAGTAPHPALFSGHLVNGEVVARCLHAVSALADPPGWLVATCHDDRLRFESLSLDAQSYARFDFLSQGYEGETMARGTTCVVIDASLQATLESLSWLGPLKLRLGAAEPGGRPRPQVPREAVYEWAASFAHAANAAAAMRLQVETSAEEGLAFLRSSRREGIWIRPGELRRVGQIVPGGLILGDQRLNPLVPLMPYATSLRGYWDSGSDQAPFMSAWELVFPGGRFTLVISDSEGTHFLNAAQAADWAPGTPADPADARVAATLNFESAISPESGDEQTLLRLAAAGVVGYDQAEGRFFHREIPLVDDRRLPPAELLEAARRLAQAGLVRVHGSRKAFVLRHTVAEDRSAWSCSCRGSRWETKTPTGPVDPCVHYVAFDLVRSEPGVVGEGAVKDATRTTGPAPYDVTEHLPGIEVHATTTVRLHPRLGAPSERDSHIGGPLLWPAEEAWPQCGLTKAREGGGPQRRWTPGSPVNLVPIGQIFASDVPEIPFPGRTDLVQVLWCPYYHEEGWLYHVRVLWRKTDEVSAVAAPPPPPAYATDSWLPRACVLHPERVREYPWVQDLPEEMQDAIYPEDDHAADELTGLSTDYQYLLSTAPGFKVGGSMSYCVTDGTAPRCKVCAGEMFLLLQMDSTEWDGGSGPRWMPLEERSLERGSTHYADAREPVGVSIGRHSHLGIYICPADPLHEHQVWGQ